MVCEDFTLQLYRSNENDIKNLECLGIVLVPALSKFQNRFGKEENCFISN